MCKWALFIIKSIPDNAAISSSIVLSGGFRDHDIYKYFPSKKVEWIGNYKRHFTPLPDFYVGQSMVITNSNELFLISGDTYREPGKGLGKLPTKTCFIYKIGTRQWQYHSYLNEIRTYSVAIAMDNGIYLFGGEKPHNPRPMSSQDTVEFLPKNDDQWKIRTKIPLNGFHGASGVAISKNEIFITGGWRDNGDVRLILIFNISTNKWLQSFLKIGRLWHASFVYKENVIICGGADGTYWGQVFGSTEILSLSNGTLRLGGSLQIPRKLHGMGLVKVDGKTKLIAFGGKNEMGDDLSSIEEWNETTEQWELSKSRLSEPRSGFAFCSRPKALMQESASSQWHNFSPI